MAGEALCRPPWQGCPLANPRRCGVIVVDEVSGKRLAEAIGEVVLVLLAAAVFVFMLALAVALAVALVVATWLSAQARGPHGPVPFSCSDGPNPTPVSARPRRACGRTSGSRSSAVT